MPKAGPDVVDVFGSMAIECHLLTGSVWHLKMNLSVCLCSPCTLFVGLSLLLLGVTRTPRSLSGCR